MFLHLHVYTYLNNVFILLFPWFQAKQEQALLEQQQWLQTQQALQQQQLQLPQQPDGNEDDYS